MQSQFVDNTDGSSSFTSVDRRYRRWRREFHGL